MHSTPLLVLALVALTAFAEKSSDSTGDYYMDFGQVYGAAVAVQQYRDICSEAFPDVQKANAAAYSAWRTKHLKFLQEMEKHKTAMAWKEAKGDEKKYVESLAKMSSSFDRYKDALREQLKAYGPDGFRRICMGYPEYLQTDRGNLEYFYAEQVVTVRRGPQSK